MKYIKDGVIYEFVRKLYWGESLYRSVKKLPMKARYGMKIIEYLSHNTLIGDEGLETLKEYYKRREEYKNVVLSEMGKSTLKELTKNQRDEFDYRMSLFT